MALKAVSMKATLRSVQQCTRCLLTFLRVCWRRCCPIVTSKGSTLPLRSVSTKRRSSNKSSQKKEETSLDGTVMSMLNFGGLGPAHASKSSNITTGKTVVTILMTTCYNHEECFAIFSDLTSYGWWSHRGRGVAARVREPTPFFRSLASPPKRY